MKIRFLFLPTLLLTFSSMSAQRDDICPSDSCMMTTGEVKEELKLSRNFFVEIGGPSFGVGVGYDQRFNPDSALGWRVGLAYTDGSFEASRLSSDKRQVEFKGVTIPLEINGILGTDISKFELGLGAVPCILNRDESIESSFLGYWRFLDSGVKINIFGSLNIGYRLQRRSGFFMRVGCAVLAGSMKCSPMDGLLFSPNLALGYTLR